jgi:hypothetical protein
LTEIENGSPEVTGQSFRESRRPSAKPTQVGEHEPEAYHKSFVA